MWFRSLLTAWKSATSQSQRLQRPLRRVPRLSVEHLEDRSLPSSYSAASASTLIADINAANKSQGTNTITLTAVISLLTVNNNVGNLRAPSPNGLPVIAANDKLTIIGNDEIIVRANGSNVALRFFDVAAGASLTLQNLTLNGGEVGGANGSEGGAIYNQGTLTLSGVSLTNNQSGSELGPPDGGAIWSNGSLTLENGTLLEGNSAQGVVANGGLGGALYVAGGTANITNTTFTNNSALGGGPSTGDMPGGKAYGGAIYVAAGHVILTADTVNHNLTDTVNGQGAVNGALAANGAGYGGGIYIAGGTVSLASDTVDSNVLNGDGGYGGGIYIAGGTVTLTSDTLESNNATTSSTSHGGGVFIAKGATVYLDSFTVANTINNIDSSGTNGSTANLDGPYTLT